ncbi:MAG: hypothetical protein IT292_02915 [Deltaproteobacteria bacterium]|nr:hypothetical protein [Deltaproteobacteria bacterium]
MKRFIMLLVLIVSYPASAILIDAVDDAASKALANSLPFMGCAALWDVEGGPRYSGGSGTLVCNNEQNGAWVITAKHAIDDAQGLNVTNFIRYTFEKSYLDAFPKDTTGYLPDKSIAVVNGKAFFHPTQDIALAKLERLVYNESGALVMPIEFYFGSITSNQTILFGGNGQTGIPSQAGPNGTGYRDGYKRCARGVYDFLMGSEGVMNFSRSVPLPGIACIADSGGFAGIEVDGKVQQCGILVMLYDSGENADTSFEYFGYDPGFFDWMNNLIQENSNITTPTPTPTITATPTPTPTEHESAVAAWDIYQ